MTDRGMKKSAEHYMNLFPFVRWDRFCLWGKEMRSGLSIFGWIDREDAYKDFLEISLFKNGTMEYMTSSARYSLEIYKILNDSGHGHKNCQRVEHHFDVNNAIHLQKA